MKGFFAPTIAWKYNSTAYAKGLLVQRMSHLISIIIFIVLCKTVISNVVKQLENGIFFGSM